MLFFSKSLIKKLGLTKTIYTYLTEPYMVFVSKESPIYPKMVFGTITNHKENDFSVPLDSQYMARTW